MDIQIRDVTAFADGRKLVIDRIYPDKAESGAVENRKELKKLLRACERGDVGIIIIPCLDRLSRDVRIAENLFWKFEQLGVRVLIADMPFYNGDNRRDVLIRQIREAIAEENRKDIIERLWKGRQERVRQGKPPGGNIPYGYQRNGKGLKIHASEAAIISTIFRQHEHGVPASRIADGLNSTGHRLRNGGAWRGRQVLAILRRRELYEQGVFRYGKIEGSNKKLILLRKEG